MFFLIYFLIGIALSGIIIVSYAHSEKWICEMVITFFGINDEDDVSAIVLCMPFLWFFIVIFILGFGVIGITYLVCSEIVEKIIDKLKNRKNGQGKVGGTV